MKDRAFVLCIIVAYSPVEVREENTDGKTIRGMERLLEEKVGELEDVQPQREFRYTSGGKPVEKL